MVAAQNASSESVRENQTNVDSIDTSNVGHCVRFHPSQTYQPRGDRRAKSTKANDGNDCNEDQTCRSMFNN